VEPEKKRELLAEQLATSKLATIDVTDAVLDFGEMLGTHAEMLTRLYLQIKRHRSRCLMTVNDVRWIVQMEWQADDAAVVVSSGEFAKEQIALLTTDLQQLFELMGQVDAVYSTVLPLGSVITARKELFPDDVVADVDNPLRMLIIGRKVTIAGFDDHFVVDYLAEVWPVGYIPDVQPIVLTTQTIESVVSLGYESEFEDEFSERILQTDQIKDTRISTAYMTKEQGQHYFAELADVDKKGGIEIGI
jgi:hypothetical protein